ncbi:hypothetical protein N7492_009163 [Penicillium capsulatum]|uniref:Uncharacterized protein n=1 Tax=Penicillium capsulatum TaxID=69766 RepID=A0A9W9HUC4_9EURO|nr:hypothetical protein N7492_009163 [Penicillium capsulatum]KAJ6106562.1 hypothetical protein N7512_010079 [Penicillium capsulatum]
MAAPKSKDTSDLSGSWHLNRELSEDPDKIFALQAVPWVVRKVLKYANLSLHITQTITSDGATGEISESNGATFTDKKPVTILQMKQTVHPGGFNSEGTYPVNGEAQDVSLPIFGDVNMMLQFVDVADIENESLRQKLSETGLPKTVISETAYNAAKGWHARVIWGFEYVKGAKYLTRNIKTWNDKENLVSRMVYDYKS